MSPRPHPTIALIGFDYIPTPNLNRAAPGIRLHGAGRRRMIRAVPCCLVLAVAAAVALALPARAGMQPRFEAGACDGVPDIADVLPRLRCGIIRVPRDHAHPGGATYALAVVIVRSERQPAQPDPVVYISGGPGGPLTIYAGYQARHPYAPDRDLILVDQRGTGRSEPHLCPDLQVPLVLAMLAVVTDPTPASVAADRAAHTACRDQVVAKGIDLNDFGTAATVEDFEWVRLALGSPSWNVVGESYGTTVATTLMARHPANLRSVVLDSLNPPDTFFTMPWSERVAHARDALLTACDADRHCGASSPELPRAYRQAVARLARDAPTLSLPSTLQVPGNRVRLTPSLFEEVVGRLVYYPTTYAGLPRVITATRDGDLHPVTTALATLLEGVELHGHEGPFIAVECRDRRRWREAAEPTASALDLGLIPPGVCGAWSALGPAPEVPRDTTVPTLILAGQFDPNITPGESRGVTDWLGPRAHWVMVADVGHSVRHFSPCAQGLVAAFIADPGRMPDTACAKADPAFKPAPP